jgi:plastocyanin
MVRALAFGIIVCALATAAFAAVTVTISQQHRAFATSAVTIGRHDMLHFTNDDDFTHQIYIDDRTMTFESDEQDPGQTVDVPFPAAGVFQVRCHIHPKMLLTVTVK